MKKTTWNSLIQLIAVLFSITCMNAQSLSQQVSIEEITFHSGDFKVVGDLRIPGGKGLHPIVVFVHGDGPNSRNSGGSYPPIMERMLRAGYATFAWDKPGTGESTGEFERGRLFEQRTKVVLDAIDALKQHHSIDSEKIGLWGISQAGYVMPLVLEKSNDVSFMIAVSCPGGPGVDQGAYLVSRQAVCEGLPEKDVKQVEHLLSAIERVRTYEEYVRYKEQLISYPALVSIKELGLNMGIKPREEWHAGDLSGDYYWDPMEVISRTTIPVLAFFGEKDTQVDPFQGMQAYKNALEHAGNPNFRLELIPDVDHLMIVTKTGCLKEIVNRTRKERLAYEPLFLEIIEKWLEELDLN
jgi:pimeloyl-ACP methyl ester carboxylesterase